jgi:hypothetical protein
VAGKPQPRCPIRDGPCGLCIDGVTGPEDCGLVWLVMQDPELRAGIARQHSGRKELVGSTVD